MGICHQQLQQWTEAVACYKEAVEQRGDLRGTSHPEYASAPYNLACLFANLKQYEEAIPRGHPVPCTCYPSEGVQ
jgi:hypothetical protein